LRERAVRMPPPTALLSSVRSMSAARANTLPVSQKPIVDAKSAPTTDGTVIVFSVDSHKWSDDSRFVRAAPARHVRLRALNAVARDAYVMLPSTAGEDHRHRPLGHPSAARIGPEFALLGAQCERWPLRV
jgi:hypothetical protein